MFHKFERTEQTIAPWEASLIAACRTLSDEGDLGGAFAQLRQESLRVESEPARAACRALAREIAETLTAFEQNELLEVDRLLTTSPVALDNLLTALERTHQVEQMRAQIPETGLLSVPTPASDPYYTSPISRVWVNLLAEPDAAGALRGAFSFEISVCRHALRALQGLGVPDAAAIAQAREIGKTLQWLFDLSSCVEDITGQTWKLGKSTRGGIRYLDRRLTEYFGITLNLPVRPDGVRGSASDH